MQELDAILESAVAYEVRGAQALDESNWVAAADYFRKGIALAPNEPSLRHKLGTALAMSGDPRAVEQFEEVTRRWPKFAKAQYSLGLILASSGRNREAIEHFSAAVKSDPAYSEARLQLAETLRASGRFQESLPQYRRDHHAQPAPRRGPPRLRHGARRPQADRRGAEAVQRGREDFSRPAGVRGGVEQPLRRRIEPLVSAGPLVGAFPEQAPSRRHEECA